MRHKSLLILKSITSYEIEATDNVDIIFRGNSLATKALDSYMKLVGKSYLETTLGKLIKDVYENKKSVEVDPAKIEKGEDVKANFKRLLKFVKDTTQSIFDSVDACPPLLREVFHQLQERVKAKFTGTDQKTKEVRYTVVGGFLFLRFFCPAILAPKLFGLSKGRNVEIESIFSTIMQIIEEMYYQLIIY